jgi:hypothetical protein
VIAITFVSPWVTYHSCFAVRLYSTMFPAEKHRVLPRVRRTGRALFHSERIDFNLFELQIPYPPPDMDPYAWLAT